jgi:NadR type nicotinamide-nucleotide adenylyltransferase
VETERTSRRLIRVVLTGSESTGKSTLARQLAEHYDAELVPEFVRHYAANKGAPLDYSDHGPIARGQIALEDEHARHASSLLILDTDLLSTAVYCAHYFGRVPDWISETVRERRPDLYLLCDIDVPWIPDPVRDRGHLREEMQQLFRDATAASGAAVTSIVGDWDTRWSTARNAIDSLIKSNLLSDPSS